MPKANPKPATSTKQTKTDQMKDFLREKNGMTVADLSEKLGWQAHSTRAALTRLAQAGIKVEKLAPEEGTRQSRYRISGAAK